MESSSCLLLILDRSVIQKLLGQALNLLTAITSMVLYSFRQACCNLMGHSLSGKVGTVTMVTGLRTAACPTSWGWGASTAVGFPSDGFPWLTMAAPFTWVPLVLA